MKATLLICTLFALTSSSRASPLPPDGSFRLTVEDVVRTTHCRVVTLNIEARPAAEMMELRSEGRGGGSCVLRPTLKGKGREGQVVLSAMRSHSDSPVVTATVLQASPDG